MVANAGVLSNTYRFHDDISIRIQGGIELLHWQCRKVITKTMYQEGRFIDCSKSNSIQDIQTAVQIPVLITHGGPINGSHKTESESKQK